MVEWMNVTTEATEQLMCFTTSEIQNICNTPIWIPGNADMFAIGMLGGCLITGLIMTMVLGRD